MNRREFLIVSSLTGAFSVLPSWARTNKNYDPTLLKNFSSSDLSPIQRVSSLRGSRLIDGDAHDEAHEIFWNKDGYIQKKGGIPKATAHYDVVIIGGGISGLTAAYTLRGKKILLLEGNSQMGGNSKAQNASNSWVSKGAAYIGEIEEGGEIDLFLNELGISSSSRKVTNDPVTINGKVINRFWEGESDPSRAAEFVNVKKRFDEIFQNDLPELPIWDMGSRHHWDQLDRASFREWLRHEFGEIHPHILELITLYCWSSFAASPDEISAAHGLYFFVNDTCGSPFVFPGGNGFVADAIYQNLKARNLITMKGNAFAVDLSLKNNRPQICFKDDQRLETVTAEKCIVAAPKMVMKHVISNLDPSQKKAMDAITYRAYLVANVFLRKKISSVGYDLFTLQNKVPTHEHNDSKTRVFTDVIFSDWANHDRASKTALTLYMPLPYSMAQQYLFLDNLYEKYEARLKDTLPEIISSFGCHWEDIEGWSLTRYGHSMPLARTGMIADGTFELASRDIGEQIFFANQDNWGNPCFETSWKTGMEAARKCR